VLVRTRRSLPPASAHARRRGCARDRRPRWTTTHTSFTFRYAPPNPSTIAPTSRLAASSFPANGPLLFRFSRTSLHHRMCVQVSDVASRANNTAAVLLHAVVQLPHSTVILAFVLTSCSASRLEASTHCDPTPRMAPPALPIAAFRHTVIHACQDPTPCPRGSMLHRLDTFAQECPARTGLRLLARRQPDATRSRSASLRLEASTPLPSASGCAATRVLSRCEVGDHVLVGDDVYGGTFRIFTSAEPVRHRSDVTST